LCKNVKIEQFFYQYLVFFILFLRAIAPCYRRSRISQYCCPDAVYGKCCCSTFGIFKYTCCSCWNADITYICFCITKNTEPYQALYFLKRSISLYSSLIISNALGSSLYLTLSFSRRFSSGW